MKLLSQYPLVGLIVATIGGILLIWWILRQPGEEWPKPQARDTFPPLFDPFDGNDDPALKVGKPFADYKTVDDCTVPSYRKRDSNGRFAKNSLTKTRKRVSAKTRQKALG